MNDLAGFLRTFHHFGDVADIHGNSVVGGDHQSADFLRAAQECAGVDGEILVPALHGTRLETAIGATDGLRHLIQAYTVT